MANISSVAGSEYGFYSLILFNCELLSNYQAVIKYISAFLLRHVSCSSPSEVIATISSALVIAQKITKENTMKQKTYQAGSVKKYILYAGIVCVSGFSMTGCAVVMGDLQTISADQIGCPPHAITIQNETMGYFNDTWTAKCDGRTFYCTRKVRGSTECDEARTD